MQLAIVARPDVGVVFSILPTDRSWRAGRDTECDGPHFSQAPLNA